MAATLTALAPGSEAALSRIVTPKPTVAKTRLESLDGMRGVCALIIIIFHFDLVLHNGHLLNHGWLCVDAFFVLSGFVIALTYEDRLSKQGGIANFFKARCHRLIPASLIGNGVVTLCVFLAYAHGQAQLLSGAPWEALGAAALFGLLLIPNFFSPYRADFYPLHSMFPLNVPLWSLFGEWVANLVYAAGLFRARISTLLFLTSGTWALMLFHALHQNDGWSTSQLLGGTARACAGFLAGVVLFRLFASGWLQKLPSLRPELIYSMWFAACAVPMPRPIPIFEFAVASAGAMSATAFLIQSKVKPNAIFVWLGKISYPLYVSHFAVVSLFPLTVSQPSGRHSALFVVPMSLIAIALAWCIYRILAWASTSERTRQSVGSAQIGN